SVIPEGKFVVPGRQVKEAEVAFRIDGGVFDGVELVAAGLLRENGEAGGADGLTVRRAHDSHDGLALRVGDVAIQHAVVHHVDSQRRRWQPDWKGGGEVIWLQDVDGVFARRKSVGREVSGLVGIEIGDQLTHAGLVNFDFGGWDWLTGGVFEHRAGEVLGGQNGKGDEYREKGPRRADHLHILLKF